MSEEPPIWTQPEAYLAKSREVWTRAAEFSDSKEKVYPEHAIVQEFDSIDDKDVLEYGCGGGSDALSYLRRGNRVWAADICLENINATLTRAALYELDRYLTPVRLTGSAPIPLPDASMDVINAHGVLHHIPDPMPVLQEFHRILRPDGRAYVMLYTEHLFKEHAPTLVYLLNNSPMDVWEAFGQLCDGAEIPYARAYDESFAYLVFMTAGFEVHESTLYHKDLFRRFKLQKAKI